MMMMMPGRARLSGERQTVQDLTQRLTSQLGRPVTDATGLTKKYDITLTFSTEGMNGPMGPMGPMPPAGGAAVAVAGPGGGPGGPGGPNPGAFVPEGEAPPDIFAAVQAQLGLKLESKKGPVELIVVDKAERVPTETRVVPATLAYTGALPEIRAKDQRRIRIHPRFASRYLSTPRDIVVYLPPGYDSAGAACPVLYLQDGQNLFDPHTAFGGQDWRADVTADDLILRGAIEPLITRRHL